MKYLVLVVSIFVFIKTTSYGIYEIKNNSNLPRWYHHNINCYCLPYLSKYCYIYKWNLKFITYI